MINNFDSMGWHDIIRRKQMRIEMAVHVLAAVDYWGCKMKQNKRMPVGVEDFKKLREKYYFVDKTKFIQELIDGHSDVTLITRPRRFGKTLMMSMLYYFFTNKNAKENRKLFDGCAIAEAGEEYMAEQGTRPVVFLSLKDVKGDTFDSLMAAMQNVLQTVYLEFRELSESETLDEAERTFFVKVKNMEASPDQMQFAVSNLTKYLCRLYDKKTILLIDEYDAPIQSAWEHGYYDKAIGFFRNFLSSALKTNPALDFAVLTGVLRISKESIFSALNNLKVSSVIQGAYDDVMGFTKDEVEKMAADLGHADKTEEIKEWYDGYNFSGKEIYNPWSVIRYFDEGCRPGTYWANTSGNSILKTMLARVDEVRRNDLAGLMQGKTVFSVLNEGLIYDDIYKNKDALCTMLLTTGYLKCVGQKTEYGREWSELAIPSREIRSLFDHEIIMNLSGYTGESTVFQMLDAMLCGNKDDFADTLRLILLENVSVHDAAYPETFYHGMMLGFSLLLDGRYEIESNKESGYGRFDLVFIPKDKDKAGVIMEFKKAQSEDALDAKAEEALKQIEDKEYMTAFAKRGIQKIWKYGIAFCGKKLALVRG